MDYECPFNTFSYLPLITSHNTIVISEDPLINKLLSLLNETDLTGC